MKKALIVAGLVAVISACGGSVGAAVVSEKHQTSVTTITTPNEYGRFQYRELKINGRSCILADYDYAGYLALTCDWSAK